MAERVVIAGGTGLIGQALTAGLAAHHYEVVVLSRRSGQPTWLPDGARLVQWDAHSAAGWGELADGAAALVNLAGASISARWTEKHKQAIRESRLNAARAVVEAVEQAQVKPRVLIQASGIGYYGARGDEEIVESEPPGTDFLSRFAVQWEGATASVERLGVRRAIIRSGVVLSTVGGALPLMALPFRFFAGGPIGSGRQWLPWIHVADEVAAIRFLIENDGASGPFNLVAPGVLTNAGFGRALARVLRRPYFFPAPAFAMRLLLGEMSIILLEGQRAVSRKLLDLGYVFHFPEAEAALRDLLE